MADMPSKDNLAHLESEILRNPTSEGAREKLLWALSADPERSDDPRRLELIEWFLEHNPRNTSCTTPLMRVNPKTAPEAYRKLKARWLTHISSAPTDTQLGRCAGAFIPVESIDEGKRLLESAIAQKPDDAKLWLDLGRMSR